MIKTDKIGIIAGGGSLPLLLIDSLAKEQRNFFVVAINGESNQEFPEHTSIEYADIGQVNKIIELFKNNGITEIVLAGKINRPSLSSLKVDSAGVKLLAKIAKAKILGDDSLLRCVIDFLEDHGFKMVTVDSIMQNILASSGTIGAIVPSKQDITDMEYASVVARSLGMLDVGQAVIVENGLVLGVEAAEGTDALINRCAKLKRSPEKAGVLVKMKKPTQTTKADLPAIGLDTIINIYQAGLAGVAIESGAALILNEQQVIAEADKLGIFIYGIN